jgi:hypothetical protein
MKRINLEEELCKYFLSKFHEKYHFSYPFNEVIILKSTYREFGSRVFNIRCSIQRETQLTYEISTTFPSSHLFFNYGYTPPSNGRFFIYLHDYWESSNGTCPLNSFSERLSTQAAWLKSFNHRLGYQYCITNVQYPLLSWFITFGNLGRTTISFIAGEN